jgi:hypothetical protein
MRMLRFALRWGAPPLLALGSFGLGYAIFFAGLASSKLSDGTDASFHETASKIAKGNLLEKASSLERVAWLLEICAQPKSLNRDHALFEAIQHLQPSDFLAAVADVNELSNRFSAMDGKLRVEVIEAVIERWMDVDEEGMIRWLALAQGILESGTLKLPPMGAQDLGAIYGVLARRKPGWTFEQLQSLGPKMQPAAAVNAVMRSAVEAGSPEAERWLTSFKGGPFYEAALASYAETLARTDPERALNRVLADGPHNHSRAVQIIMIAAEQRPAAATALLDKLDAAPRKQAMQRLPGIVAMHPNFDAFEWLEGEIAKDPALIEVTERSNPGYLVTGLAMRDAPKTMEWIQKYPESSRAAFSSAVIALWTYADPKAALEWIMANPRADVAPNMPALEILAAADPDRFAAWMSGLPAGAIRQQAHYGAAEQLLRKGKVAEAIEAFPKDVTGGPILLVAQGFGSRVASDVNQATRWLETLQSVPLQLSATRGVIERWMLKSPAAAAAWAENLPAGTLRDSAAGAIAINVADRDFEAASDWLAQVENERLRDRVVTDLYAKWQARKPGQAREWLRSVPRMSESVRNRLLEARP